MWGVYTGERFVVEEIDLRIGAQVKDKNGESHVCSFESITHHRPVMDVDGVPIKVGDMVWPVEGGGPLYVDRIDVGGQRVTTRPFGLLTALDEMEFEPSQLTHAKPEIDTWQRIEEDARGLDSGVDRELFTHTHEDIVRRCKALAEREKGE